jgi:hypothetical protein
MGKDVLLNVDNLYTKMLQDMCFLLFKLIQEVLGPCLSTKSAVHLPAPPSLMNNLVASESGTCSGFTAVAHARPINRIFLGSRRADILNSASTGCDGWKTSHLSRSFVSYAIAETGGLFGNYFESDLLDVSLLLNQKSVAKIVVQ